MNGILATFIMAVVALSVNPTVGAAQTSRAKVICGGTCVDCGLDSWEGIVNATHEGPWEQTCDWNPILKYCTSCPKSDGVASGFIPAMTIASTLQTLEGDQLSSIFKVYSDRIRLNPARYQIIITGTQCDESAPGAILNVERETWTKLRGLGAQAWDPTRGT